MSTVFDVAGFIASNLKSASGKKLQKLLYYSQAWALVWDRAPLFPERIEAWADGPVSPHIYGKERYDVLQGNPDALTVDQQATVLSVIRSYGKHSGEWLSELTHRELPWIEARHGLPPGASSKNQISHESMTRCYSAHKYGTGKEFSAAYIRGLELVAELPEDELAALKASDAVPGDSYLKWLETGEADCDDESSS